jgi:hypothetical protein
MELSALLLMLAGAAAQPPVAGSNPPQVRLICRYEAPTTIFGARRKLCLTAQEWEKRVQEGEAASHIMLREYLGNTNCMGQGLCTNMQMTRPSRAKRRL